MAQGLGRSITEYAVALTRRGRVAACVLAPELPPPANLPIELSAHDLVRWDEVGAARRLLQREGRLAYQVLAPFLHSGPGEPASLAISAHWARSGIPRVVSVDDLSPLVDPARYLSTPSHAERYRARARWVGAADLLLTPSEHTRREAIERLGCAPHKVVTVGAGVSSLFCPPQNSGDALSPLDRNVRKEQSIILSVSRGTSLDEMIEIICAVGQLVARGHDLRLLIVGNVPSAHQQQLCEASRAVGVGDRMVFNAPANDESLRDLYRRADLTVTPSPSDGPPVPALESAACGTPALVTSTAMTADGLERLLTDQARRAEILSAQQALATSSTWDAVATKVTDALDRLGESLPPARWVAAPMPPRLALVGPIPPRGGGIGDYNARLLHSKPHDVHIDVVTSAPAVSELPRGVGHVPCESFGIDVRPASYDAVVYTLGNSSGHLSTVELALRHPGWLWLHEVRLPAVATTALEALDDAAYEMAMGRLLRRAYPGRAPLGAARRAGRSHLSLVAAGVGLVAPLAERCRGILVNSEFARRLLLLDLPPEAHHPPVHVLPPACPPVRTRETPRFTGGDQWVVAFGVVSWSKRPDLLVDAVALGGCRLAFVGPCPPFLAAFIQGRARLRGIDHRVEVTDAVDEHGWRQWMDRATLAVQLRESVSGETSAALLEALAAGVPVLTNMASAAEYPEGAASIVSSAEPGVVAARISALLGSRSDLLELTERSQEFAADHQFQRLAETVVSIVTT